MDKRAKLVTEQMFSCHKTGKEYNYRYNEIMNQKIYFTYSVTDRITDRQSKL